MLNIAICDNLSLNLATIQSLLLKYEQCHSQISLDVNVFKADMDFLKKVRHGEVLDLLILSLMHPQEDILFFVQAVSTYDRNIPIIFITESADTAWIPHVDISADYLPEPPNMKNLFPILDRLLPSTFGDSLFRVIDESGARLSIPFCQINFITSLAKSLYIHLVNGQTIITAKLSVNFFARTLYISRDSRFLKTSGNCLINMSHVEKFEDGCIIMKNGEKIKIAKQRQSELGRRFSEYKDNANAIDREAQRYDARIGHA